MKEKLIERVKDLMSQKDMTAADLARKSGIRASSISDYLPGKYEPKQDKIDMMAQALNVNPAWLMGYENEDGKKGVRIPVLGQVAAGIPIDAIQEVIDWEEIPEKMSMRGDYYGLKIRGNSMEPLIDDGDTVIFRQQPDAESGDIVIALVNGGEGTCKKLKKYDDGIALISINSSYEPMIFTAKQVESLPVRIIGRVVELRRKF